MILHDYWVMNVFCQYVVDMISAHWQFKFVYDIMNFMFEDRKYDLRFKEIKLKYQWKSNRNALLIWKLKLKSKLFSFYPSQALQPSRDETQKNNPQII